MATLNLKKVGSLVLVEYTGRADRIISASNPTLEFDMPGDGTGVISISLAGRSYPLASITGLQINGVAATDQADGLTKLATVFPEANSGDGGSGLPSQTGNVGKFLKTDGSAASWDTPVASLGYLVYTALLSQSGTDDPVATVLQNTLVGTVVWTRQQAGIYIGTLAGVFHENKTVCPPFDTEGAIALPISVNAFMDSGYILKRQDNDSVSINSFDDTWTGAELSGLIGNSKLFIEVRVYP